MVTYHRTPAGWQALLFLVSALLLVMLAAGATTALVIAAKNAQSSPTASRQSPESQPTSQPAPQQTPTAAPETSGEPAPEGPATEQVMMSGPPYCPNGCWGLAEWNTLAEDPVLRGALILAYHYVTDWRPMAKAAAGYRTVVVWGQLPDGIGGQYYSGNRTITVSTALKGQSSAVLAAILVHEVVHAASPKPDPDTRQGAADCLAEEMEAYSWTAKAWISVPHAGDSSTAAPGMDALVSNWQNKTLRGYVLLSSTYQHQCLGEVLPDA